jgi:AraC-like DNA-binding protein
MQQNKKHWENSIIVQATYREFKAKERIHYQQVQSCYLAYCTTGQGKIKINNHLFEIHPNSVIFAPWNHSITYMPSSTSPYVLGCLHLIPDIKEKNIHYGAFHSRQPGNQLFAERQNEVIKEFVDPFLRQFSQKNDLTGLIDYAINKYTQLASEEQLRLLARLLFFEIYSMVHGETPKALPIPPNLKKIITHIENYLETPINMDQLRFHGNLSEKSIFRLFRKYLNTTPQKYITHQRLLHAANVLNKTTTSINSLSESLQFSTPGNFCRAFKKEFGISPMKYRNQSADPGILPKITRRPHRNTDDLN